MCTPPTEPSPAAQSLQLSTIHTARLKAYCDANATKPISRSRVHQPRNHGAPLWADPSPTHRPTQEICGAHLLSSRGSSPFKLLRRQGCGDVPRVPTGRRSSYSSVLARVAGMPIDVNSFSDEEFIARVRGSGLRDAKLKSILDERRARHFIDVADLKRRVRPKLTDRELTWLCVGAGSASALPSPKRQRIARASRAIADCSAPCSAPCSVHWLSRGLVSRSVCAHAQSARAGDSRGDAHAPVIADPPPRRRTSSVGSAPGECCARHVPRTLLTSRYGSRVGRGAGMCPAWPLRFDTRAP